MADIIGTKFFWVHVQKYCLRLINKRGHLLSLCFGNEALTLGNFRWLLNNSLGFTKNLIFDLRYNFDDSVLNILNVGARSNPFALLSKCLWHFYSSIMYIQKKILYNLAVAHTYVWPHLVFLLCLDIVFLAQQLKYL